MLTDVRICWSIDCGSAIVRICLAQLASRLDAKQTRIESAARSLRSKAQAIATLSLFFMKGVSLLARRASFVRWLGAERRKLRTLSSRWS